MQRRGRYHTLDVLRCGISTGLMTALGQNPNLPRRSIAVRFTLNKQTPTGGVQYDAMCQEET
jgi:hypothetical protein